MSRTYGWYWCAVCGEWITSAGAARTAHLRKHVKHGEMIERKVYDRGYNYHFEFDVAPGIKIKTWKKVTNVTPSLVTSDTTSPAPAGI
jgi:hypothetical protein